MQECTCPSCGYAFTQGQGVEVDPVKALEIACRERGLLVTPDGRVREHVAAELLGFAPGTLRNWSYADPRLPFTTVARRRTYKLSDIAALLEK